MLELEKEKDYMTRSHIATLLAILTGASLTQGIPVQAQVLVLDDFTIDTNDNFSVGAGQSGTIMAPNMAPNDLGGELDVSLTATSVGASANFADATDEISVFSPISSATLSLTYDGVNPANAGINLDISQFGGNTLSALQLNFDSNSLEATDIAITLADGNSSSLFNTGPVAGSIAQIDYSNFSGIDFNNITSLDITFSIAGGGDGFSLTSITAVPEPSTVVGTLAALSLGAGLAFKHRKRFKL